MLLTLYAGDKIPDLMNHFEAAVAQPPVEQLLRTLHMSIWRTGVGDIDHGIDLSGDEKPPSPPISPKPCMFSKGELMLNRMRISFEILWI